MWFTFWLCNVILEIVYWISFPFLYFFLNKEERFERLGLKFITQKVDIVIHAASVGEINGIKRLIFLLCDLNPTKTILLTCNTITGKTIASNIHPHLHVQIAPLDIFHIRLKQLRILKPEIILIAETEIWPNLMYLTNKKKIPLLYINARIEEKTFQLYFLLKHQLKQVNNIQGILCQTNNDAKRFQKLFSCPIITAGSLKYAVRLPNYNQSELRFKWGYNPEDFIITMGSSRPGEEELIFETFKILKTKFSNLKLIIAPRHIERLKEIITLFVNTPFSLYSQNNKALDIFIFDKIGQLAEGYALCDIAIIGGSFFPFRGHNPLEAAFYAKPIIIGPYHQSCIDSVTQLLSKQAIIISDINKLKDDLVEIISNINIYKEYGNKAKQVLIENEHTLDVHWNYIKDYIK